MLAKSDDPLNTVSGTTVLTGAVDTVLVLNRDSQGITLYSQGLDSTPGIWSSFGAASEVRMSSERKTIIDTLADANGGQRAHEIAVSIR